MAASEESLVARTGLADAREPGRTLRVGAEPRPRSAWTPPQASLVHCFARKVVDRGARTALRYMLDGTWHELSWLEWHDRARCFAAALIALGVQPGDRVAVLSSTRIEWTIADIGSAMAGAVTTPIYASSTPAQVAFIVQDCAASIIVCEDTTQLGKLASQLRELPSLRRAICIEGSLPAGAGWAISWDEAMALGEQGAGRSAADVDARIDALEPGTLATLVYTSGTSGRPKGVRITHENVMYTSEISVEPLTLGASDTQLLFLPMAHIMGRTLLACSFFTGGVSALHPNPPNLLQHCRELGVTFLCGVPRVLEKLHAALGREPPERVRQAFGPRMRFILSGGAPLPRATTEFFRSSGVPVYEGYGLTESSGTLTVNLPGHSRDGSVGRSARGTELRIAPDGEILAAGPGVMDGYHRSTPTLAELTQPTDGASLQWIDGRRWLSTGDIGRLDDDGYLWITDRKKDVFKLSTGKSVAPAQLENLVKRSDCISQVVVYGESRPYVTALCTLNPAVLMTLGVSVPEQHPEARARVEQAIAVANQQLAPFEQIRRFAIVHPDFSLESGELTATLKTRRGAIIARYAALLASLYDGDAIVV